MNIQSTFNEVKPAREMLKEIFAIALPCIIAMISQMIVEVINLSFIGHLGDPILVAGVGLGNMYINAMGFAVLIGVNTTVVTFVSQSNGQGNIKLCGIYLNRGRIVSLIFCVPVIAIMLMAEEFFLLINIDQQTSAVSQLYVTLVTPVLIAHAQFDLTRQFLNCFEKSNLPMYTQIVTTSFHLLWCYIFVNIYDLGIIGTGLATNITFFSNLIIITLYVTYFEEDLAEAWFWPNKDCFKGLIDYMRLGVPAMLMLCLEWWTFELLTFIASFISIEATGSQVIILNTIYVLFSITIGFQYSSQALIGRAIGAQNIKEAKKFRMLHMYIGFTLSLILFSIMHFLRFEIAIFYTNIESLQVLVAETFKVVAIAEIFDCIQGWQQGIIRGLGMFNHAMIGLLVCFYLICIPLGYLFAFEMNIGLKGLWYGFGTGLFFLACYYLFLTMFFFDWHKIAQQSQERANFEKGRCDILKDGDATNDLKQPLIDF